jgi:sugar PTS system EIIA component
VELLVTAPLAGTARPLSAVPDRVFAEAIVGPGVAIDPVLTAGTVGAPIAGTLMKVKAHAFVVVSTDGRAVLVHLGIDTVSLDGAGFTVLATEGAPIAAGQPVVAWDPVAVVARGLSPICPVVALEATDLAGLALGAVGAGDPLFSWL